MALIVPPMLMVPVGVQSFVFSLLVTVLVFVAAAVLVPAPRRSRPSQFEPPVHPVIAPSFGTLSEAYTEAERPMPIQLVRAAAGSTPRTFDRVLTEYNRIAAPDWLLHAPGDPLLRAFDNQHRIRRDGQIVWAAVVQFDSRLTVPITTDGIVFVLYSMDPRFDGDPDALLSIAHDVAELKGHDQVDPACAAFSRMLTLESARGMGVRVPSRFTNGAVVLHTSLLLPRRHLPLGFLNGPCFPVWVDPEPTHSVILVPAAYWPPSLLAAWNRPR